MAEEATQEATQEATTPETPEGESPSDAQEGFATRENKQLKETLATMQTQLDTLSNPPEAAEPVSPPVPVASEETPQPVMSQGDKDRFEFLLANQNKNYDGDDIAELTALSTGKGQTLKEAEDSTIFKSYLKDKREQSRAEDSVPSPAPVAGRTVSVGDTQKEIGDLTLEDTVDFVKNFKTKAEEAVARSQARRTASPTAI